MTGRKLLHAGENGPRTGNIAVPQQGIDRSRIDRRRRAQRLDQGPRRRGERQFPLGPAEEQRLLAQRIADQVNGRRLAEVDDGEGVHAADPPQQPLQAPLLVTVDERLPVSVRERKR